MKMGIEKRDVLSLMYHDVVEPARHQASGFASADAALYKLGPDQFEQHLAAINQVVFAPPILATDLFAEKAVRTKPWIMTFDDGGASSYTLIADRLESLGWRAHFFITTDYIDKPAF